MSDLKVKVVLTNNSAYNWDEELTIEKSKWDEIVKMLIPYSLDGSKGLQIQPLTHGKSFGYNGFCFGFIEKTDSIKIELDASSVTRPVCVWFDRFLEMFIPYGSVYGSKIIEEGKVMEKEGFVWNELSKSSNEVQVVGYGPNEGEPNDLVKQNSKEIISREKIREIFEKVGCVKKNQGIDMNGISIDEYAHKDLNFELYAIDGFLVVEFSFEYRFDDSKIPFTEENLRNLIKAFNPGV